MCKSDTDEYFHFIIKMYTEAYLDAKNGNFNIEYLNCQECLKTPKRFDLEQCSKCFHYLSKSMDAPD